jgi:hypothetical protein
LLEYGSILPGALLSAGINRLLRGAVQVPTRPLEDINDPSITNSVEELIRDLDTPPRNIPVQTVENIPVQSTPDLGTPINVRNLTQPQPTIREFPGDSPVVTRPRNAQELAEERAAQRFREQDFGTPDDRIEGVGQPEFRPSDLKTYRQAFEDEVALERKALDDALANGEINKTQYKQANKDLDEYYKAGLPKEPEATPGRKIEVKQVEGIDVADQTVVPKNMPETPGRVRVQTQAEPMKAKTEAVAKEPIVMYRSESPNRFGKGMAEMGEGLYIGDEKMARLQKGTDAPSSDELFRYEIDPNAKLLQKGATGTEYSRLRSRAYKEAKTTKDVNKRFTELVREAGYDGVQGNGEIVIMNPKAVLSSSEGAPAVRTPAPLPKEVQNVLDNPKQYNKRQVQSARRQARLAQKYAEAQQKTSDFYTKAEEAKSMRTGEPVTTPGADEFAPTGKFGTGVKGDAYEKASREAEKSLGQREMAFKDAETLAEELSSTSKISKGDGRRISAAKENLLKSDPNARSTEIYKLLDQAERSSRRSAAQIMALVPRTVRKTASSDELLRRFESKLNNVLDDPSKVSKDDWSRLNQADDVFTEARDKAFRLEEQFKKTGSEADFKAWEKARASAVEADVKAKLTEIDVAQKVLRGEKGAQVTKLLNDLKKEADVNTMDFVTANMLSGTGTGFRNLVGTELAGIENRILANTRAKVTNVLFNQNVGGFDKASARFGRSYGAKKFVSDTKRRAEIGGKNPIEWAKNWATTINSAGEGSMQSQLFSRMGKYYKNQFSNMGLSGKELDLRMRHAMLSDPDNIGPVYMDAVMKSSGLSGFFDKGQKIEQTIVDAIGRRTDSRVLQGASKLIMRLAVGFPTAGANFLYQSGKRLTLGAPSFIEMGAKLASGDKIGAAQAFERGLKEFGSGGAVLGLGVGLGSAGLISGPYPSDADERARWEREGISENSIKMGGAWYPIPQGAGMFGLPLLTGAAIGRDGAEGLQEMYTPKNISKLLPTDQLNTTLNMIAGNESENAIKNFIASIPRALTPAGALFNQISRSLDSTKNDTTTKDFWNNVFDQILTGIPGQNKFANIPDKTDAEGNVIKNPNPLQIAAGATSVEQPIGVQRSQEINQNINEQVKSIADFGGFDDPVLESILEGDDLGRYKKAKEGKQLDESDIKSLYKSLTKGVEANGSDTAYLEREQYDTNLTVLNLKKQLMEQDPTTAPSSLKKIDLAIKRSEVYKNNTIPYQDISDYKDIGVEDWRAMGDPDSDSYDPDMYQKLFEIDQLMTKAGVSYGKKLDKPKYFLKEKKSGSGGGRSSGTGKSNLDFGTLGSSSFAPKVKEYQPIEVASGSIPKIGSQRPNIVYKIGVKR